MENIKEKISYLKGLSDGLGIDHETKEGKILLAIIDVLDDMAEEVMLLEDGQIELDEYVEAIDEDLALVEEDLYGEEDMDECDCDHEDDGYIEIECPNCNETIFLDEEMLEDEDEEEIICPNCNEPLVFESECCCGDHDHHHHDGDHDCCCK